MRRALLLAGAALVPFNFLIGVNLGPANVRPLQLWALAMLSVEAIRHRGGLARGLDGRALLFWTAAIGVMWSTLLATPPEYRTRGFLDATMFCINVLVYTAVYGSLDDADAWPAFFRVLAGASIVAALILIARAVLTIGAGSPGLADSYQFGLGTVTGTFATAFAAAAAAAAVFASRPVDRWLAIVALVVHTSVAALSLARGPWLGFALAVSVVVPLGLVMDRRRRVLATLSWSLAALATAAATIGLMVAAFPAVLGVIVRRLLDVANLASGTGSARLALFQGLWDDALRSPVFGHGAASYRRVSELLGIQGTISENFALEIFHAGGGVAVIPLLLGFALVAVHLLKTVRAFPDHARLALTCLCGLLAMLAGALTNPAAWNASFWALLAVCAALDPAATRAPRPGPRPA